MALDGDESTQSTVLSSSTSTHPSSLTPPSHYNEFSDWVEEANLALEGAFPIHRQPRNGKVGVLLLRFENDGLGVISEVAELQSVFVNVYGFETEVWNVPDEDPQKHLSIKLYDFYQKLLRRQLQPERPAPAADRLLRGSCGKTTLGPKRFSVGQ